MSHACYVYTYVCNMYIGEYQLEINLIVTNIISVNMYILNYLPDIIIKGTKILSNFKVKLKQHIFEYLL